MTRPLEEAEYNKCGHMCSGKVGPRQAKQTTCRGNDSSGYVLSTPKWWGNTWGTHKSKHSLTGMVAITTGVDGSTGRWSVQQQRE